MAKDCWSLFSSQLNSSVTLKLPVIPTQALSIATIIPLSRLISFCKGKLFNIKSNTSKINSLTPSLYCTGRYKVKGQSAAKVICAYCHDQIFKHRHVTIKQTIQNAPTGKEYFVRRNGKAEKKLSRVCTVCTTVPQT